MFSLRVILSLAFTPSIVLGASPKDVVRGIYSSFQTGDMETFLGLLHDDFTYSSNAPMSSPSCTHHVGKDEFVKGCLSHLHDVAPGFQLVESVEMFGEGENVYSRVKMTTTAGGDTMFGQHWTVRDGKAMSFYDHQDTLTMDQVQKSGSTVFPSTVVKQAYDLFSKGDIEKFSALLHPQFVFEGHLPKTMPCSGPYHGGKEWIGGCIMKLQETWPGFNLEIVHMFSEGAYVMVTAKATNDVGMDTYFGQMFKVVNGLIIHFRDFADTHAFMTTAQANKAEL